MNFPLLVQNVTGLDYWSVCTHTDSTVLYCTVQVGSSKDSWLIRGSSSNNDWLKEPGMINWFWRRQGNRNLPDSSAIKVWFNFRILIKGLTKIEEYWSIEKDLSVGPNNLLRAEEDENRDYLPSFLFNAWKWTVSLRGRAQNERRRPKFRQTQRREKIWRRARSRFRQILRWDLSSWPTLRFPGCIQQYHSNIILWHLPR